jgi:RNA polymerase sigma-70 factor (ECF subfamily)
MTMVGASAVAALRPVHVSRPREGSSEASHARRAFERMVREHEPALRAFATRLCGSASDGNDLVQDCLERALRRHETFTQGTNGRAWLFTILHNAFIDRCRRRATDKRGPCIDDVDVAAPEPSEPPAWTSVTAEQFAGAIERLDEEFRSVYRLHAQGLAYQEISVRLGIPVSTVGTRLVRARAKLRALLEAALEGEEKP